MPGDDDKKSAWSRIDGEAERFMLARPRFERGWRHLFVRRPAARTVTLTAVELNALLSGRALAVNTGGGFVALIGVETEVVGASLSMSPQCREPVRPNYSDRIRIRAAQVRANADRRVGASTPQWILRLASSGTVRRREE